MTAAKNQKRHPLPRLGVFGQPELPTTQAAPGRVRWAALTVLLAVCLVCYNYTDLPLIVRHSISFWDALRTGRLNQFYQLATALPISARPPARPARCPTTFGCMCCLRCGTCRCTCGNWPPA